MPTVPLLETYVSIVPSVGNWSKRSRCMDKRTCCCKDYFEIVSDGAQHIINISEIRLFADDCVCYREIKNVELTVKLQKDIDHLGSWARKWGMGFQPVKCNMMQLTNKRTSKIQASYKLEGTVLENVESIKYLEVTITKDLKWNTHISNVCTKANRTFFFFRRNLFSCPQDVREAAYRGLVRPILDYGSSVWDPHYEGLIDDLVKVQKRAARFITRNYTYEKGSMTDILKKLK